MPRYWSELSSSQMQHRTRHKQCEGMEGKIPDNPEKKDGGAQGANPNRRQMRLWQSPATNLEEDMRGQAVS